MRKYTVSFKQTVELKIRITVEAEDAIEAMVRAGTIAVDCEPNIAIERTEESYGLGEDARFETNFQSFKWCLAEDWLEEQLAKEEIGKSHETKRFHNR